MQRKRIDDDDNSQLDIFINSDDETVVRGRFIYRAIATNLDELSDSALVHWYNQRGEASENRLKELRSDFAAARLPCGDFDANAAWLMLSSYCLQPVCLDADGIAAFRGQLPVRPQCVCVCMMLPRQNLRHVRQWTVKVNACHRQMIVEALNQIRGFPLLI